MKAAMIVAPIVIVCAVLGLAFSGTINIPGLTPAKPKAVAAKADAAAGEDKKPPSVPAEAKKPTAKKAAPPAPTADPKKGIKRLAMVWNEMDVPDLVKISQSWNDADLVPVLVAMDNAKVAEFLTAVASDKPDRASKLSKSLQKEAAQLPIP